MTTVNVTASCGYLATVEHVLAGQQVGRALTLSEQVVVAHRIRQQGRQLRIAATLGVSEETVTELLHTDIRLLVPLDAVRCVMCGCADGVLVVGEFVMHSGYKCDLAQYTAPALRWRPVHWAEKRRAA